MSLARHPRRVDLRVMSSSVSFGKVTLLAALLGLALVACGDGSTEVDNHDDDMEMTTSFGEPAEAADADRVVEMTAHDDFSFDPAQITVTAGETITFRVTNVGNLPHDFTLGDEAAQEQHEAEMSEMDEGGEMAHDAPNVLSLPPGETHELTWHFTEPGTVLIGCHEIGHYAAGMIATITVEP
jgi:uncharacterized cupredoxin-like copper-binding protein